SCTWWEGENFALVAAICRRLRTLPSYIASAGSRISSQIARSLPLDLSRQVARGVSVHARKQRNASVRQPAIRGRFGSQVPSMSLVSLGGIGANLPATMPVGPSRYGWGTPAVRFKERSALPPALSPSGSAATAFAP